MVLVRLLGAGMVLLALLGYRGTVGGRMIGHHKYMAARSEGRESAFASDWVRGRFSRGGSKGFARIFLVDLLTISVWP